MLDFGTLYSARHEVGLCALCGLPLYLSEFSFRLNGGNVVIDMIDRLRSLVRGVVGKRLTYRMLVHGI